VNNKILTTFGVALALLVGHSDRALTLGAGGQSRTDDRAGQYGGSTDARQHGYEHAYRDGADRGRQDRERRTGYSLKDSDYQSGAREYETSFGNRNQYMRGYREGYKAGYDDGYNDRAGQYGQLYGRPPGDARAPTANDAHGARSAGSAHMGFDVGYRDGITAGQQDHGRNVRSNFRGSAAYQSADLGYRANDGDKDAYRLQFRDGFERGYEDGYGRSQYSSDGGGYFPSMGATGAADTRDGQGTPTRTIIVAGNRQWTPTTIRVNQGDALRLDATGEIHFSSNANDRAGTAGSPELRYLAGAPLPKALAGALIGRIDNGLPFGIGNQTSLIVPASGILYLGVNDDNVGDNSGQFQVLISW
jgi:hypothetical protein